jgi:glycosyltransferase involved in cell wall biosynthesis
VVINFLTKGTEKGMNILHITAGLPPGGGIAEAVPALCVHLQRLGHTVVLATVARLDVRLSAAAEQAAEAGVRVVRFKPRFPHFLFFSPGLLFGLGRLVREADVVHVHSNWTFPVWWGCWCARRTGKKLVMSPQGCLDPVRMRHSAWKKRLVGWMDRYFLRRASVIHVTSEAEREWVERFQVSGFRFQGSGGRFQGSGFRVQGSGFRGKVSGFRFQGEGDGSTGADADRCGDRPLANRATRQVSGLRGPVVVIPNGVDAAAFAGTGDREAISRRWPECQGKRVALFLSRLHPLKGLEMLIDAWAEIPHAGWQLLVVGTDEAGHEAEIKARVERRGLAGAVTFGGPRYGDEKVAVMQAADLFVLPTHSENFGIVVAEALACGVPVITTKGAPWGEILGEDGSSASPGGAAGSSAPPDGAAGSSAPPGGAAGSSASPGGVAGSSASPGGAAGSSASPGGAAGSSAPGAAGSNGRCGWWVDVGVDPLARALEEAMSLTDEERRAMGENGRRLVEAKYQWPMIAARMARVYEACRFKCV